MPTLYWCPHQVLKATGALEKGVISGVFFEYFKRHLDDLNQVFKVNQVLIRTGYFYMILTSIRVHTFIVWRLKGCF